MLFNIDNWSIRIKVLIPTIMALSIISILYIFVFTNLFIQVKDDAFSDHIILLKLEHNMNKITRNFMGDNTEQLTLLSHSANDYYQRVLSIDGLEEEEELEVAAKIHTIIKNYTTKYPEILSLNANRYPEKYSSLKMELLSLEKQLFITIEEALEIVTEEANEDLEALLNYEVISAVVFFTIILLFVINGLNLILHPLEKLRKKIDTFRHEYHVNEHIRHNSNDEIKLLIQSSKAMKEDIQAKQQLLESALVEAEKASIAKTEFLANISHELRTPMLGILGFAELGITKLDIVDKTKLLKYFNRIHTSGKRLLLLLNNLLDLSKLEAGQVQFEYAEHSINDVINDVIIELGSLIKTNQLQAVITADKDDYIAEFDLQRIHQVLYNLISNAIKFSPEQGTITIIIIEEKMLNKGESTSSIKVIVKDQGIGIPNEELESIFDKFSQSTATNTGAGGTGLGLSICKDICYYHNAPIWAENATLPNTGARFIFSLPKIRKQ